MTLDQLQALIDSGHAWLLEGSIGREASRQIHEGQLTLGPTGGWDYYGNYIPSRTEVVPGTPGSIEWQRERHPERLEH